MKTKLFAPIAIAAASVTLLTQTGCGLNPRKAITGVQKGKAIIDTVLDEVVTIGTDVIEALERIFKVIYGRAEVSLETDAQGGIATYTVLSSYYDDSDSAAYGEFFGLSENDFEDDGFTVYSETDLC